MNHPMSNGLLSRRITEMAGMLAVGDGVIAALVPVEHIRLWRGGPQLWTDILDYFAQRPTLTRVFVAGEIAFGVWLMLRQVKPHAAHRIARGDVERLTRRTPTSVARAIEQRA